MAYDVFLVQLHETDAFYAFQNLQCLHQTGSLGRRQVNLRHVSRDNHLGVHSHAGEEHLDLLGGRVLRFIQNDDGIVQCASAHKGEGGNLDDVQLHILFQLGGRYHVLQGVIEWLQIRVYLVLHVAGQETELFSGFYGRAAEDDFLYLLIL